MAKVFDTFEQDPAYIKVLENFQLGEWDKGLSDLEVLVQKYPLEQELRSFKNNMRIRAQIDAYETQDNEIDRRANARRVTFRTFTSFVMIALVIFGAWSLSGFFQQLIDGARREAVQNIENIELSIKFRNAQNLLLAGRGDEALVLFNEVAEVNPDFENLDIYLNQAESTIFFEEQYDAAIAAIEAENYDEALDLLQELNARDPGFRDVSLQIRNVSDLKSLSDMLASAQSAYDAGDWGAAAELFEEIRNTNIKFRTGEIEEKLFNSYINASRAVLEQIDPEDLNSNFEGLDEASIYFDKALALRPQNPQALATRNLVRDTVRDQLVEIYVQLAIEAIVDQEDSLKALSVAEDYFGKALALKPSDADLQRQFDFVNKFLAAQNSFRSRNWDDAITNLEFIFTREPDFANGGARQSLYDSYIQRGNSRLTIGEYNNAIGDYSRAADVGSTGSDSTLLVFEAQINMAYSMGLLRDYEGAVTMYQQAITLLRDSGQTFDAQFQQSVATSDALAAGGNFSGAYIRYRELLNRGLDLYADFVTHIVQEDEYLSQIALNYNTTVQAIVRINDLTDPNRIFVGQQLYIPILK